MIPNNKELQQTLKEMEQELNKKKTQLKTLDEIRKKYQQIKEVEREINPNIIQRLIRLFRPKI